jgi:tocopherol cyclase
MNKSDLSRDRYMLKGPLALRGYDWWWHSFTGYNKAANEQKAFFIAYFIMNPELGGEKVIFGQLSKNKEKQIKPSYVMIKAGAWGENGKQIHGFYPISQMQIADDPLELSVGECYLSEKHIHGQVAVDEKQNKAHPEYMCDAGTMKWDLAIDKKIAFHVGYGASKVFRKINAFEMFWHAQGMKTLYSGSVEYDGVNYEITPENSFGYADKNWGGDFTSPWVWLSSCNMKSTISGKALHNSVFDIGGGRPKIFGVALNRKLLSVLHYEGKDYEFNFSKFWTLTSTKFNCYETPTEIVWEIKTQNYNALMQVDVRCLKKEMVFVNYESPDGMKRHKRLWNGGNGTGTIKLYKKSLGKKMLIDEISIKNTGCEYGEY